VRNALIAALVLLATQALAAADFRSTSWLMTRDQVTAAEGGPAIPMGDQGGRQQLLFKTYVDGKSCSITYYFENDALVSASYSFRADTNREAYEVMKKRITGGYGAPSMEKDAMLAWRLPRTEIALTWLPDTSSYVVYWQKEYFARINGLAAGEGR
jgi:hypothetical protein